MQLDFAWWVFPACILLPDISMIGYAINPKVGAQIYNFIHPIPMAIGRDSDTGSRIFLHE